MKLRSISLSNFRSYKEREFTFSDQVTLITGANGAGKTNLLEAIYVILQGKSFRDSDEELLRYGENWWKLLGTTDEVARELRYQPGNNVTKQLIVDDISKGRFTYRQQLPVILFEPDELLVVHTAPSSRREYFDKIVMKLHPECTEIYRKYERALVQRNNLLKKGYSLETLRDAVFVWDVALAEHGAKIQTFRTELIKVINAVVSEVYSRIAGHKQTVSIAYDPTCNGDRQLLVSHLSRNLEKDVLLRSTSTGAHRDDILFHLNDKYAKVTASRGEVRTLVLALKKIEAELLEQQGQTPIVLLDDVLSELDEKRQQNYIKEFASLQVMVTATKSPVAHRGHSEYLKIEIT